MKIQKLHIDHFKNYRQLDVDLSEVRVGILVGNNGQGKTNFLEALVVLALSKGLQPLPLKEMIDWYDHEEETGLPTVLRLAASVQSVTGISELEVICGRGRKYPKTLKVDDIKTSAQNYIGHLKVVLFTPQDMNLVMLSPALRRRYINMVLSQVDKDYLYHLSHYGVMLKSRNKLLARIHECQASAQELEYWDEQLVEHGAYLLWKRRVFFSSLNQTVSGHYEQLSGESEVPYRLQWNTDWDSSSLAVLKMAFGDYIAHKQSRDIQVGRTCGGPHREDFVFLMHDKDLSHFGSRGECRSALLALKLSELSYIREETGESPVLLFDDVFSELDLSRQQNLLKLFDVEQVFITTTHLDFEVAGATVWEVEDGTISLLSQSS